MDGKRAGKGRDVLFYAGMKKMNHEGAKVVKVKNTIKKKSFLAPFAPLRFNVFSSGLSGLGIGLLCR